MSRILWHGIGPWHKTGYGIQTALFAPLLRDLGHEVVIAFMGARDAPAHPGARQALEDGRWNGLPVTGPGWTEFGLPARPLVRAAFGGHDPDLVIVLKDAWVLTPGAYRDFPAVAVWANTDTDRLGVPDRRFFEAAGPHVVPVSPSLQGQSVMRAAGLRGARYIPHGIDTGFWTPGDRAAARDLLGLPQDTWIAGINAANIGPRKGFGEQFESFGMFHGKLHRNSLLLCHTAPEHPEGINLRELAAFHDITSSVKFGSHSSMTPEQMRTWYRSLDVLMAASYGEGFGLPIVEALSCGIPVIAARSSAMTEKITHGCGWLVETQPWWNPPHQANWAIPRTREITAKLGRGDPSSPAVRHDSAAARYDAGMIARQYWMPLIEELVTDGG